MQAILYELDNSAHYRSRYIDIRSKYGDKLRKLRIDRMVEEEFQYDQSASMKSGVLFPDDKGKDRFGVAREGQGGGGATKRRRMEKEAVGRGDVSRVLGGFGGGGGVKVLDGGSKWGKTRGA